MGEEIPLFLFLDDSDHDKKKYKKKLGIVFEIFSQPPPPY